MKIPYRRIRTDIGHLYFYGSLEVLLGVFAAFILCQAGWRFSVALPVLACFSGRGGMHVYAGIQRRRKLAALGASVKFSRTIEEIEAEKARRHAEDRLYLGEGFVWGPEHAQAYHEIATLPEKEKYFSQLSPEGGSPYIHALGSYIDSRADQPQIHLLPEHTALIGSTGVGKTRAFEVIIAQLINRGDPVIIIDPKSDKDLLDVTYQCCMSANCTDRFQFFSLAHPQVSARMNPCANYSTPGEIAGRITSIMPNEGNSRPFVDFCYDVLSSTAHVLILIQKEITLKNLYYYAVLQRQKLLLEAMEYRANHTLLEHHAAQLDEAIAELEVKISHDAAHFQKMTTSLLPVLGSLTSGNVGAMLNPEKPTEALTWERILREKMILYMSLASMKDSYVSQNIGKLFVQDFVSFIGTAYTRQSAHEPKHLVVDEAASIIYEGYVDIANKCRAAGVHLYLGLQTTADIEAKISEPVQRQIYGLIANKLYMRVLDLAQAEELADALGKCVVPQSTKTRNLSGSLKGPDLQSGDLYRSGFSERMDMVETELLPLPVLSSLPRGQAILVTQGYPPIKLRIPLINRDGLPAYSFFEHVASLYQGKAVRTNGLDRIL